MAKYIFRCIDNRLYACNVGDYCTGHSWYMDDAYTSDFNDATVYDESNGADANEIEVLMLDCAGDFEQIEVPE